MSATYPDIDKPENVPGYSETVDSMLRLLGYRVWYGESRKRWFCAVVRNRPVHSMTDIHELSLPFRPTTEDWMAALAKVPCG